jgi:hypothetical protein
MIRFIWRAMSCTLLQLQTIWRATCSSMQRAPGVFRGDVQVAQRFFQALATEPDGTRATVQEAINRLAKAYESTSAESNEAIKEMLTVQSQSSAGSVRTCAVTWACSIFAFGDPFARHMCVLAAADPKQEVRVHLGRLLSLLSQFEDWCPVVVVVVVLLCLTRRVKTTQWFVALGAWVEQKAQSSD